MDVDKCIYNDDAILPAYKNFTKLIILFISPFFLLDGKWQEIFPE